MSVKHYYIFFADDTKAYTHVSSPEDGCRLQRTLDKLTEWSDKNMIGFNPDKCKVLHLGKTNLKHDYVMKDGDNSSVLIKTVCEKDLGVYIDDQLNINEHVQQQVEKARCTAGVIHRNIVNKTPNIMVPLFKSMVRPIVEYANAVWAPHTKKNSKPIENIQRHYTKTIQGFKDKSYKERLTILKLPSLSFRRLRGDLIEVYKIVHNIYDPITTKKTTNSNSSLINNKKNKFV